MWNRTESKGADLVARGARWAATPADAVAASAVSLINVVDHGVLDGLVEASDDAVQGNTIVGLSSDTPERARGTAKLVAAAGGSYLDGAIMVPTTDIGTPAASILFAGPRELYDAYAAVFAALGTPTWLGEEYGLAAGFDVALLNLFWTSMSGFLRALKVAQANGIEPDAFLPHALGIVDILPPIFTELAERTRDDNHTDSAAPASSVAASLGHLIAAERDAGVDPVALQSFQRVVDKVVAAGHGDDEITRVLEYL